MKKYFCAHKGFDIHFEINPKEENDNEFFLKDLLYVCSFDKEIQVIGYYCRLYSTAFADIVPDE